MKNDQIKDRSMLNEIIQPLTDWYRQNKRILPWRDQNNAYYTWVSEIMLQQTRVEAVKPYFQRFIGELPDVQALAECPEEKLMKLWEGLGYYNRVRNMQTAARTVVCEYEGVLPASYEELLSLKGIGNYTAGAIASIAYQIPVPAVDGNVLRVISRITEDRQDIMKQSVLRHRTCFTACWSIRHTNHCPKFHQRLIKISWCLFRHYPQKVFFNLPAY